MKNHSYQPNIITMWKTLLIALLISFAENSEATKKRVCIIGAGLSGLVSAKYISEYPDELETIVFEKNSDVGGLWIYTDSTTVDEHGLPVHSSVYKNLRTNGVKNVIVFPDYPQLGDEASNGRFLKHEVVLEYLRNYTEHFHLRQYVQFNTNVEKIEPLPRMRWLIIWKNLNDQKINKTFCDAVIVCNGHNFKGNIPKIPGIENFNGKVLHSHVYRKPEAFANQTMIVLGASISGKDIAIDISTLAEKVYLSHRHDKLPGAFPSNLEQVPGVVGAEGSKLVLSNGTKIRADALIFYTGYIYDYPFLDESSGIVVKGGKHIHSLHKHIINIERPSMAFMDITYRGLHFQAVRAQINYFRAVLLGKLSLPSREQMLLETQKELANAALNEGPISSFEQFFKYYDELVLPVHAKRLPWWAPPYIDSDDEVASKYPVHYKDMKFVINEANRTVEFVWA